MVTFGAFVEILQGVEGLVHISELAAHHVENPREVVAPGQHVIVKIIDIDADRRRLSLSMKRVSEHEPLLPPIALVPGDKPFLADEIAAEESGRAAAQRAAVRRRVQRRGHARGGGRARVLRVVRGRRRGGRPGRRAARRRCG